MSLETVRAELGQQIGQDIHVSDWVEITQDRVNAFATATDDHQWIHTNPARAAAESPWSTTIAHGYLTLSLYPMIRGIVEEGRPAFAGLKQVINYGLNKLRFTNAVKVGARVRGRSRLLAIDDFKGGFMLTEEFTMEIEGEKKPACIAEILMRYYF
jgi:acyl dehydratase